MNAQTIFEKLDIAETAMSEIPAQAAFWAARKRSLMAALAAMVEVEHIEEVVL